MKRFDIDGKLIKQEGLKDNKEGEKQKKDNDMIFKINTTALQQTHKGIQDFQSLIKNYLNILSFLDEEARRLEQHISDIVKKNQD